MRAGLRDGIEKSAGFSKNVKKLGSLIIGERGKVLVRIITSRLLAY